MLGSGICNAMPVTIAFSMLLISCLESLFRGELEILVTEYEVLRGLRLVAIEAAGQVCVRIGSPVGPERLVLPFAIALSLRIFSAPSGALLHHGIADDIGCLD